MDFNKYQKESKKTWIENYNHDEIRAYLGLADESGEVLGKLKKKLRGDNPGQEGEFVFRHDMLDELGDILYYIARVCEYNGFSLEDVAIRNIDKLSSRQKRNKIKGNGDNR